MQARGTWLGVMIFVCAQVPSGARAAESWMRTFGAEAAASYLGVGRPAVLVVASGGGSAEEAAEALRAALRGSRKSRVVMDGAALGDVSDLADAAIVKKASALPVDEIAVVRVFPGGEGGESTVVTLYDKKGAAISALSAERGVPLAKRGQAAGEGVSEEAANTVLRVIKDAHNGPPETRSPSEVEFDKKRLGFERLTVYSNGVQSERWGEPCIGRVHATLDMGDFYRTIGRQDLASSYGHRRAARPWLIATGVIFLVGGAVTTVTGGVLVSVEKDDLVGSGDTSTGYTAVGVGVGMLVVGGGLVMAGGLLGAPTSDYENWEMAQEHNVTLRKKLGLPDVHDDSIPDEVQEDKPNRPSPVSFAPAIGPRGAGMTVRVRF